MKESHFKSLGNSFPFRLKCIKSIFYLLPQTLVPSKPLTASSASLGSSISTNAKPGGLLATQTFLTGPYLAKASSRSYLKEYQIKKSLHQFSLQTFCIHSPIGIISETSNIDFTGNIPISVSHFDKIFWTLKLLTLSQLSTMLLLQFYIEN